MEITGQKWIDAAHELSKNPKALVTCPECENQHIEG